MGPWTRRLILAVAVLAGGGPALAATHAATTDDAIADNLHLKLAVDPVVKGLSFKLGVVQGVVSLSGCAPSANISRRAEQLARKIPGVKMVRNGLTVGHC